MHESGLVKPRRRCTPWRILAALFFAIVLGVGTVGVLIATKTIRAPWDASKSATSNSGGQNDPPKNSADASPNDTNSRQSDPVPAQQLGGFLGKRVEPTPGKVYFGAHLWGNRIDWSAGDPQNWNKLSGMKGAGFGGFADVDANTGIKDPDTVLKWADQIREVKGFLLLTLEPMVSGLDELTDPVIAKCGALLKQINDKGVPVLLRFAHEMNGIWYFWSQQPKKYRDTWIRLVKGIRASGANLTSTVWAPNTPNGYPWSGSHGAKPGSDDYKDMDTNGDGTVDARDDPYLPYWPGKEYVDWVGISVFYFGPYPYGKNQMPNSNEVKNLLTGSHSIIEFAKSQDKPFGVFEAGAAYYTKSTGGTDFNVAVKKSWLQQLSAFKDSMSLLMQFEIVKTEDGGTPRDFALWNDPAVATMARQELGQMSLFTLNS